MSGPISVVVPIAPSDCSWKMLLTQLKLPENSEIILACGGSDLKLDAIEIPPGVSIKICSAGRGRAGQMNAGAQMAEADYLWFLHADSGVVPATLAALPEAIRSGVPALYFFDLRFANDGPWAMALNEWAVRMRAGLFKIPFGDQGFFLPKALFFDLGTYREDLSYGEDHVFVWKVRQEGYPVVRLGAPLFTSARKYQAGGWFSVTLKHVLLTIRQAVPEWFELYRRRIGRIFS